MISDLPSLPSVPGCYVFRDSAGLAIYVGKAKDLKKRVSSYMKQKNGPKTSLMLSSAVSVDFVVTRNEVEALILENTLIKKHRPKFNIDLKDAKGYAYLRMTDETFPRLVISRDGRGGGKLIGPFVSAKERDDLKRAVTRIFRIRTCSRLPKRPCLRYHLKLCDAPCIGGISEGDYSKNVLAAIKVLSGDTTTVISGLEAGMKKFSSKKNYETAIKLRDRIAALKGLEQRQVVKRSRKHNEDIIGFRVESGWVYLMLFHVYRGTLTERQEFTFENTDRFLDEFLVRYYSNNQIPGEIILPREVDPAIRDYLSELKGAKVKITVPKRGDKLKLEKLVEKNIELVFFGETEKLRKLKKNLKLPVLPEVMECFDISHLSGKSMTGSMVQFRMGRPDKSNYRRFKIRSVSSPDDPKAIAEVVTRRYSRLLREGKTLPDLVVVDGGKPQLNSALKALNDIGADIPVVAIAKKNEELYLPGRVSAISLPEKDGSLQLLRAIRDEAHRFAVTYNRLLRRKEAFS